MGDEGPDLHRSNVEFGHRPRIHVCQTLTRAGFDPPKSGKARDVPLLWDVVQVLRDLPRRSAFVFCEANGEPLVDRTFWGVCTRTMRAAKLTRVDGSPKILGGHSLRHTWASHCMMRGLPPRIVMDWAGWGSLAMLERYSHLSPDHCEHIDRLVPRPSGGA
ncbi:MAG: tyrosine-type recombinase/integrase [Myxococcota bacterium]